MRRIVVDTNIYIDWFNARRHEEVLFRRDVVKHLSAVVLMELYAGAVSDADRWHTRRVESSFARVGRIVVPTRAVFVEAGHVLRRLQSRRGFGGERRHTIGPDILIALSARTIGATVVTQNARHYRAIQSVCPFQLEIVQ